MDLLTKAPFLRRSLPVVLLAFGMFGLGGAFHKYRLFPYSLVKNAVAEVERQYIDPKEQIPRRALATIFARCQ